MEIRALGPLEVVSGDGHVTPIHGPHQRTLLIALAIRCGQVVADDHLVEILWPEHRPAHSANALQRHISALRRLVRAREVIERRGAGYALRLDRDRVDVFRFEMLVAAGREALRTRDPRAASDCLRSALDLWRGDALADVTYDDFAQADIARLNELRLAALEARIDADLELGRHHTVVGELTQLVIENPLREHLRAQLMSALSMSGRPAEALREYQAARAVLGEEVGLEPSRELRALEAEIVRDEHRPVRVATTATTPGPRPELPAPLTAFVGRRSELDDLRTRLRSHRLVTVVGPGGVGKSRLALEALRGPAGDRRLVELSSVSGPDAIVDAVLNALGLPRCDAVEDGFARLVAALRDRDVLLLLDNCEHVIEFVAALAHRVLESCPAVRLLATTREPLGVPGEVLWRVGPLTPDDAVALFLDRARAAAPTIEVASHLAGTDTTVAEICDRLDRLPLAIELAAARLAAIPIRQLAEQLSDRFRLLTRGPRTVSPRQQTLRAVVDWSYDLLTDDERLVLDRLSVFSGGCTFAAARGVCCGDDIHPDDVGEIVTRLAEKSLAIVEDDGHGTSRCRLLQTFIDYGRERLEATGSAASIREVHTAYYADLVRRSAAAGHGDDQRGWLLRIASDLPNIRAAFDSALATGDAETAQTIAGSLGWYWWFTGSAGAGATWVAHARSLEGDTRTLTRARLAAWTAFLEAPGFVSRGEPGERGRTSRPARRFGCSDAVDRLIADAVSLYREAGASEELAGVELALAVTLTTLGNHAHARDLLLDAEHLFAGLDATPRVRAFRAFAEARRAFVEERHRDAEVSFHRSVALLDSCGADVHRAFAHRYIGRLARVRGDHRASTEAIESAIDLATALNLPAFTTVLLTDLAESAAATGDFDSARRILDEPLSAARRLGSAGALGEILTALALLETHAGDVDAAERAAVEALDLVQAAEDFHSVASCCQVLGGVAERRRDAEAASAWYRKGLDAACAASEPHRMAANLEGLAGVAASIRDGRRTALLLGAASSLRQSPGSAAGSAFAPSRRPDTDELLAVATARDGEDLTAKAFAAAAADPDAVIAAIRVGDAVD